jgi:probable rRNA maturation factor
MNEYNEDGSYYLGDIIVNKDQALRQSGDYGNSIEEEIAQLVEHGVLHLLGIHHDGDDDVSIHGVKVNSS